MFYQRLEACMIGSRADFDLFKRPYFANYKMKQIAKRKLFTAKQLLQQFNKTIHCTGTALVTCRSNYPKNTWTIAIWKAREIPSPSAF